MSIFSFKLDKATHDLVVSGGRLQLINDIEVIARNLENRLMVFKGEWVLDNTYGFDFNTVLGQRIPDLQLIESQLKSYILDTDGVTGIVLFKFGYVPGDSRLLTLDFTATTIYGGEITISDTTLPPTTAPPPAPAPAPAPGPGPGPGDPYLDTIINEGPIVFYRLGDALGSNTMVDSIAGRNGAHAFGAVTLGVLGLNGDDTDTCANYDTNNNNSYSNVEALNFAGDMTVEVIIKVNSLGGTYNRLILAKGRYDNAIDINYWLNYNPITNKIEWNMRNYVGVESTTLINPNQIYHIVGVRTSLQIFLYINGVLESAGALPALTTTPSSLSIGHPANIANQPSNMKIDEVSLYDKALTAAQVLNHYNAARIVQTQDYSDLILSAVPDAYYQLLETSGTIATDSTGLLNGSNVSTPTLGSTPLKVNDPKTSVLYGAAVGWTQVSPVPSSILHTAGDITVELLHYKSGPTSTNVWRGLVAKATGGTTEYSINLYQDEYILIENDNGASFFAGPKIKYLIRHIAVTMAASGVTTVYLDGVAIETNTMVRPGSTDSDIYIGVHPKYAYYASSNISDVAFYSRLLSPAEILSHANKALVP